MRTTTTAATNPLLTELLDNRAQLIEAARRVVRCAARAEDVVQDVAVRVCLNESEARILDPGSYLRRMVRNAAIDVVRQAVREGRVDAPLTAADDIAAPCTCPHARLETCETLRTVLQALETVPRRTREAFLAHRIDGVPQKSIAAEVGVSPTLVNFMIRDASALCRAVAEAGSTVG